MARLNCASRTERWAGVAALAVIGFGFATLLLCPSIGVFSSGSESSGAAGGVVFACSAFLGMGVLAVGRASGRARARRADYLLCMYCGYDLNGETKGICPECGDRYEPEHVKLYWGSVYDGSAEPR